MKITITCSDTIGDTKFSASQTLESHGPIDLDRIYQYTLIAKGELTTILKRNQEIIRQTEEKAKQAL